MSVLVERLAGHHSSGTTRQSERMALVVVTIVLLGILWVLYQTKTSAFAESEAQLGSGQMVNLNDSPSRSGLMGVLSRSFRDSVDQRFAATAILSSVTGRQLPNVGAINLIRAGALEAENRGGPWYRSRVQASREAIGFTEPLYRRETNNPPPLAAVSELADGNTRFSGAVLDSVGNRLAGALVTIESTSLRDTVRTDENGAFRFSGLPESEYAILALFPGLEFRRIRTLTGESVPDLELEGKTHTIRLLDGDVFSTTKSGFVVRTPSDYSTVFFLWCLLFFIVVWAVHVVWSVRGFRSDPFILPAVALLSGLGLTMMFSLPDALRDYYRAAETAPAVLLGLACMGGLAFVDVQRWGYEYSERKGMAGIWIGLASFLSILLLVFGFGPEGSPAKVNIPLFIFAGPGIQPVELIKGCLLIFFAGYLARNWQFLREVDATLPRWLQRLGIEFPHTAYIFPIVLGVGLALIFFVLQRDLGPALVLCTTFFVLYGIVRRHWLGVGLGFLALVVGFWVAFQLNPTVGGRIEMWLSPWNNLARGGDHLAHAFWSVASGGFWGTGPGAGSPIDMPSAHTDMIIAALGEELGTWGVLFVFIGYSLLLLRGLDVALNADARFSFFLAAGIVVSSLFQLILIAAGTFGVFPLTGVVSPFLSYGKTALVIQFVFWGLLHSISVHSDPLRRPMIEPFTKPVHIVRWALLAGLALIFLRIGSIQTVFADAWTTKSALVFQASGLRGYSYNPRLLRLRDTLPRGTIYDRRGVPLATDDASIIRDRADLYKAANLVPDTLRQRPGDRLYPLGALTFYLLGDINTRAKWNAPNALYAENRYLSELRGYNNTPDIIDDTVRLPDGTDTTYTIVNYDYSPLLPFLRNGLSAPNEFVREDRDLFLSIDAGLQAQTAEAIFLKARELNLADRTIAAVVLHASTGDVLASVTYPLPELVFTDPAAAAIDPDIFDHAVFATKPPGSTLKIATAMAAFRTGGDSAVNWTVNVKGDEQYYRQGAPTGTVDMNRAVVWSSNVYFATIAREKIGAENLLPVLDAFGFTIWRPSLTRARKLEQLMRNNGNNLAQAGFGQGEIVGAPIHLARMAATVANAGNHVQPRWTLRNDSLIAAAEPIITASQASVLAGFMRGVTTTGTASGIRRTTSLPIYGKTGTAEQNASPNHGWFVGYTPDGNGSHIVVAVLVERAGTTGSSAAYPMAGAIFERIRNLGLIKR